MKAKLGIDLIDDNRGTKMTNAGNKKNDNGGDFPAVSSGPTSMMTGVVSKVNDDDNDQIISIFTNPPNGNDDSDNGNVNVNDNGHGNNNNNSNDFYYDNNYDGSTNVKSSDNHSIIDFLDDKKEDMTYGRRIALSLMNKSWYYPSVDQNDEDSNSNNNQEELIEEATCPNHGIIDDFDEDYEYKKPSLAHSWAYFEHVSLYRFIVPLDKKEKPKKNILVRAFRKLFMHGNKKYEKAEAGENEFPTQLYHPLWIPHKQLGDFGLGIGLYFSSLRALIVISIICGILSLYNIIYFASDKYDPDQLEGHLDGSKFISFYFLMGSALCRTESWVPCPTCHCTDTNDSVFGSLSRSRCARAFSSSTTTVTNTTLLFAQKYDCDGTKWQLAATNFGTVIVMVLAVFFLGRYLHREEVQFDEDEQTAADYSIQISNPPDDAKNPEEWRRYFKENCNGAQVTVCTCAVENDFLVKTLVERRERIRQIQSMLPGERLDMLILSRSAAEIERNRGFFDSLLALVVPGIPEHFSRLVALDSKVEGGSQLDYPVTNVFVTFETEDDQRQVLSNLTVGSMKSSKNDVTVFSDPKYLFRGKYVLDIREPDEPNSIRWQDLNAGWLQRMKETFLTSICTLVALFLVAYFVFRANSSTSSLSVLGSAITISIFNTIFPTFAKFLVSCESHKTETSLQTSLFLKVALFRWVSTAVIYLIITPFTDVINQKDNGLIVKVYALFFSDMFITNGLAIADPVSYNLFLFLLKTNPAHAKRNFRCISILVFLLMTYIICKNIFRLIAKFILYLLQFGHLNRHILAPRAKSQDAMNILFQGAPYELAERYTDMTKILFLNLFYCSIFPTSFFLCAISLSFKYVVDRFNLMRTWKKAPDLGPAISKMSHRYFFPISVAVMAMFSSYFWTGFPFDNLCENDYIDQAYIGTFTIQPYPVSGVTSKNETITVTENGVDYRYCNQDFLGVKGGFPFVGLPQAIHKNIEPLAYMTREQLISTTYFGWASLAVMIMIFLKFIMIWYKSYQKMYHGNYKAVGESQGIPYSTLRSRCAYIPQVTSNFFSRPLIACKIDDINEELFDFYDQFRSYKYYDLSTDAKKLLSRLKIDDPPGFSTVKSWAPDIDQCNDEYID